MKSPEAYPCSPAFPELPRQLLPRAGYVEDAFEGERSLGKMRLGASGLGG